MDVGKEVRKALARFVVGIAGLVMLSTEAECGKHLHVPVAASRDMMLVCGQKMT